MFLNTLGYRVVGNNQLESINLDLLLVDMFRLGGVYTLEKINVTHRTIICPQSEINPRSDWEKRNIT